MTNINKEGYKPSYQKSYIQLESIADKAEAARIANGTVKEHQPKRVTDDAVERMAKSDKAHLRVTDYDRMRELYEQGMTDGKIAREMGLVDQSLVRKWRDRYGIPAHGNQKRVPKFNPDLALQMYQDGNNDRQIAESMDVDRSQVYQWRKKEGLKPMKAKMTELLKAAIGEEDTNQEQPQTWDNVIHDIAEQLVPVESDTNPDTDEVPNDTVATVKELPVPVIEMASLEDVIEEKNAIIQDLLVKNAELAGFIDGIKFVKGWFET